MTSACHLDAFRYTGTEISAIRLIGGWRARTFWNQMIGECLRDTRSPSGGSQQGDLDGAALAEAWCGSIHADF